MRGDLGVAPIGTASNLQHAGNGNDRAIPKPCGRFTKRPYNANRARDLTKRRCRANHHTVYTNQI